MYGWIDSDIFYTFFFMLLAIIIIFIILVPFLTFYLYIIIFVCYVQKVYNVNKLYQNYYEKSLELDTIYHTIITITTSLTSIKTGLFNDVLINIQSLTYKTDLNEFACFFYKQEGPEGPGSLT